MDKVREEFEKKYRECSGRRISYCQPWANRRYLDDEVQLAWDYWEMAHALYTKETEPLKWRWEGDFLLVGQAVLARIRYDYDRSPKWRSCFVPNGKWIPFKNEQDARNWCEDYAKTFLAKLRGEA